MQRKSPSRRAIKDEDRKSGTDRKHAEPKTCIMSWAMILAALADGKPLIILPSSPTVGISDLSGNIEYESTFKGQTSILVCSW